MSSFYHSLTITHIKEEVPGVKLFTFGAEDAQGLAYQPGQYLTLVLPHEGEEIRRSYSITSSPALQEPLQIGVKRIENGLFSRRLIDHARVGDQVLSTGAAGFFTLPTNMAAYGQVFFWAAGSGITPIFSLIKTLLFSHPQMSVVLVYSNHAPEDTIFLEELNQLENEAGDRFQVKYLFSNSRRLEEARLHKELLKRIVQQKAMVPASQILCYVCGPENYRRLCRYGLREIDVPAENIRQETFSTSKPLTRVTPPDTNPHQVTVQWQGEQYTFEVEYPATILQAARQHGLDLPYSCETGKCGNCAAQCLTGEVWMSYNEVLTPRDLSKGLTLTCVGYPVNGPVELGIG